MRNARRTKVLVVEDDEELNRAYSSQLRRRGHHVIQEFDGLGGLGAVFRSRPDVVLLDLGLPVVSGEEVYQRLRVLDSGLPIVGITGRDEPGLETKLKAWGIQRLLRKPVPAARILAAVEHTALRARSTAS